MLSEKDSANIRGAAGPESVLDSQPRAGICMVQVTWQHEGWMCVCVFGRWLMVWSQLPVNENNYHLDNSSQSVCH